MSTDLELSTQQSPATTPPNSPTPKVSELSPTKTVTESAGEQVLSDDTVNTLIENILSLFDSESNEIDYLINLLGAHDLVNLKQELEEYIRKNYTTLLISSDSDCNEIKAYESSDEIYRRHLIKRYEEGRINISQQMTDVKKIFSESAMPEIDSSLQAQGAKQLGMLVLTLGTIAAGMVLPGGSLICGFLAAGIKTVCQKMYKNPSNFDRLMSVSWKNFLGKCGSAYVYITSVENKEEEIEKFKERSDGFVKFFNYLSDLIVNLGKKLKKLLFTPGGARATGTNLSVDANKQILDCLDGLMAQKYEMLLAINQGLNEMFNVNGDMIKRACSKFYNDKEQLCIDKSYGTWSGILNESWMPSIVGRTKAKGGDIDVLTGSVEHWFRKLDEDKLKSLTTTDDYSVMKKEKIGIGIRIGPNGEVLELTEGESAKESGISKGSKIIAINGKSVSKQKDITEAVKKIKIGSNILLKVETPRDMSLDSPALVKESEVLKELKPTKYRFLIYYLLTSIIYSLTNINIHRDFLEKYLEEAVFPPTYNDRTTPHDYAQEHLIPCNAPNRSDIGCKKPEETEEIETDEQLRDERSFSTSVSVTVPEGKNPIKIKEPAIISLRQKKTSELIRIANEIGIEKTKIDDAIDDGKEAIIVLILPGLSGNSVLIKKILGDEDKRFTINFPPESEEGQTYQYELGGGGKKKKKKYKKTKKRNKAKNKKTKKKKSKKKKSKKKSKKIKRSNKSKKIKRSKKSKKTKK